MNVSIDTSQIQAAKDLDKLKSELTKLLTQLEQNLQNQPNFKLLTSAETAVPKSTPANTILLQLDETDVVKVGYYNGNESILP